VSDEALADLRRRIQATRWPDKETVADRSLGAQLAELQELVRYWGSGYDWRKAEAKLNALPQFMTNIDGVDIHFSSHQSGKGVHMKATRITGVVALLVGAVWRCT